MSFSLLPVELVERIIDHTVPEGFQSLTLSCRAIYKLCQPRLERFNALSRRYGNFGYNSDRDPSIPFTVTSAFHLIALISSSPSVARYIRRADLTRDSIPLYTGDVFHVTEAEETFLSDLAQTLAASPLVREAGIDPHALHTEIEKAVRAQTYSHSATTFALSLLPNLVSLILPMSWGTGDGAPAGASLLEVATKRAVCSQNTTCGAGATGLAKLEDLRIICRSSTPPMQECIAPLLSLPRLRRFWARNIRSSGRITTARTTAASTSLEEMTLVEARASACPVTQLLTLTTSLRVLRYSHIFSRDNGDTPKCWDVAEFLDTVAREAGHSLEILFVTFGPGKRLVEGSTGRAILRGRCLKLKILKLPLELVTARAVEDNRVGVELLDMIPASVEKLTFASDNVECAGRLDDLVALCQDIATHRQQLFPRLFGLRMVCCFDIGSEFALQLDRLRRECERGGIAYEEFNRH